MGHHADAVAAERVTAQARPREPGGELGGARACALGELEEDDVGLHRRRVEDDTRDPGEAEREVVGAAIVLGQQRQDLVERDQKVVLPAVAAPPMTWKNAEALCAHVLKNEQEVTASINELYAVAEKAKVAAHAPRPDRINNNPSTAKQPRPMIIRTPRRSASQPRAATTYLSNCGRTSVCLPIIWRQRCLA